MSDNKKRPAHEVVLSGLEKKLDSLLETLKLPAMMSRGRTYNSPAAEALCWVLSEMIIPSEPRAEVVAKLLEFKSRCSSEMRLYLIFGQTVDLIMKGNTDDVDTE